MKTLRLILGDQLNSKHSWYKTNDKNVVYCLIEMRQETDYVTHHIQKIIGFFAAMRAFSNHLKDNNFNVDYYKLDDKNNTQDLVENLKQLIKKHDIKKFEYQLPDEYRIDQQLSEFCKSLDIESEAFSTEHFYTEREDLKAFFKGKKQYIMEKLAKQLLLK